LGWSSFAQIHAHRSVNRHECYGRSFNVGDWWRLSIAVFIRGVLLPFLGKMFLL
jgi:hypothetical protein